MKQPKEKPYPELERFNENEINLVRNYSDMTAVKVYKARTGLGLRIVKNMLDECKKDLGMA